MKPMEKRKAKSGNHHKFAGEIYDGKNLVELRELMNELIEAQYSRALFMNPPCLA